jgi:hypothetical protein
MEIAERQAYKIPTGKVGAVGIGNRRAGKGSRLGGNCMSHPKRLMNLIVYINVFPQEGEC